MTRQPNPPWTGALDDSGGGFAMFVVFTAAVLIVTGAVAVLALVATWWMLAVALAIHVLMSTAVVMTIMSVMDGRATATSDHVPAQHRPLEAQPPTRRQPVTAL